MYNFSLQQKLKDEEIAVLEYFVKSNPNVRELKRGLAVKTRAWANLIGVNHAGARRSSRLAAGLRIEI